LQTGALSSTLSGHGGYVNFVTYSPNGKLIASSSDDKTARLWGLDSGQCLVVLGGLQDSVNAIVWLNDASFTTGCNDKSASTWKVAEEEDEIRMCLHWRSGPTQLMLSSASIQGVRGLSEMNARLFQQQQEL